MAASFTEFFVTKGAQASDVNGGGPTLSTDDSPVATYANCDATTPIADPDYNIDNNNGGAGWGGTQVEDVLCWDTAGTKEYAIVTALSVGGDDDVIAVTRLSAALTQANGKNVNVGGAWATVDHAASIITTSFIDSNSYPPRANIKYDAAAYNEYAVVDNGGSSTVAITLEGYEATAGDGCPNGNLPNIDGAGQAGSACLSSAGAGEPWWRILHLKLTTSVNGDNGLQTDSSYWYLEDVWAKATGTGGISFNLRAGGHGVNCYSEDSTAEGFYLGAAPFTLEGCVANSAGTYAFRAIANREQVLSHCIADTAEDDGFYVASEGLTIDGCVAYKCGNGGTGSGIRLDNPTDEPQPIIRNCILSDNAEYGIECDVEWMGEENFNAFYSNGTAATLNVHHGGGDDVSLTGDPFTGAAGGDFSLNNTAGAGAACRGAGFPGALLDGNSTGYRDIGALQHQDAGGGGSLSRVRLGM